MYNLGKKKAIVRIQKNTTLRLSFFWSDILILKAKVIAYFLQICTLADVHSTCTNNIRILHKLVD